MKKLTEISAIQVSFSKAGFEALCGFNSLKRLDLMSAKLPVEKLALLGNLKRLEELNLFCIPGLADRDLQFLSGLKRLRKLDLGRNKAVTDEVIAKLPLLEELSLWECGITPASTDLFLSMKKLNDLSVAQTGFSRAAENRLTKAISR